LHELLSLSFELLGTIVGDLPRADLCNLSLTSKKARSITEPALYAAIELDWRWPSVEGENTSSPLFTLVYTLQRRPDLSPLIQHVALRGEPVSRNHLSFSKPGQT
jgi:F-box associated protein